ncbi:unnamed protein product [Orchesella dallaii]|uniref:Tetraspanin-31 n=1 Tax=Orchesella dallaii TaxID=48710 RepID=A0ABP1QE92_9HEXA
MWGGFRCSRNSLLILNVFYIAVAICLIDLATHAHTSNGLLGLPIIGGIIACGVFLLIVSIGGIYATVKHHQVLLFFYMVILFVLFIIQFSIACACLAVSQTTQKQLAQQGWQSVGNATKDAVQSQFQCCGYNNLNDTGALGHPSCDDIVACGGDCTGLKENETCNCPTCSVKIQEVIGEAFQLTGGVSLFFSFTEVSLH